MSQMTLKLLDNLLLKEINFFFEVHFMQRYSSSFESIRQAKITSSNILNRQQKSSQSGSHMKINLKQRSQNKISRSQRQSSQRYFVKEQNPFMKKSAFSKSKIIRSYSQQKPSFKQQYEKEQFVIRIPKNENVIENYISQLKELKRKIAQEKLGMQKQKQDIISQKTNQNMTENKKLSDQIKMTDQNRGKIDVTQMKRQKQTSFNLPASCKTEEVIKKGQKIFSRDMKQQKNRFKIFKDFVTQNQSKQQERERVLCGIESKMMNKELEQIKEKPEKQANIQCKKEILSVWPKKIIYKNVINVKQSFKLDRLPSDKKFNRYSSQCGRKLYTISKSVDFTPSSKDRITTLDETDHQRLISRRRTENEDNGPLQYPQNITQFSNKDEGNKVRSKNIQKSEKINEIMKQRKPTEADNALKSIEGFSTIQNNQQTLDILGESCMQIKKNLIKSTHKVDHILDLLGYNSTEMKQSCSQKQKKRKMSYERFSKAFPKGFFK